MRVNKKGTASEMFAPDTIIFWLIFGVVLGFVAIFFVIIISKTGSEQARISENLEMLNLISRFLESPNCFIYDKDGVLLNNVIDVDKFNDDRLSSCYKTIDNTFPAFRIILNSETAKISKTIKTKNWNDNRGTEMPLKPKNAALYSEGKIYNGEMTFEIQNV